MRATTSVKDLLSHRINSYRTSRDIEPSDGIPKELIPYVQNTLWAKRVIGLIREGYGAELHKFVEQANHTKPRLPYNYFNKSWGKDNLQDTLRQMRAKLKLERICEDVFKRLKAKKEQLRAIYAACIRLGDSTMRYAVTAQETAASGRIKTNTFKFFCWLTSEKTLARQKSPVFST